MTGEGYQSALAVDLIDLCSRATVDLKSWRAYRSKSAETRVTVAFFGTTAAVVTN
jgi:hypothetical protein